MSRPMSRTRTLCVSAPLEIRSTPVSATARTVCLVDAARGLEQRASGGALDRRAGLLDREVVEQDDIGARAPGPRRAARASRPPPRSSPSGRRKRAPRRSPGRCPPAIATWLSLIRIASSSPKRWLLPPPCRTAAFSSARMQGVVLRVSMIAACVPATDLHETVRSRWQRPRDDENRFSAVRSAARIGAQRPAARAAIGVPRLDAVAVGGVELDLDALVDAA